MNHIIIILICVTKFVYVTIYDITIITVYEI